MRDELISRHVFQELNRYTAVVDCLSMYTVESNTEGDAARQDALRRMYEHKVENHNFDRCHRYLGDYFIRESVITPLSKNQLRLVFLRLYDLPVK